MSFPCVVFINSVALRIVIFLINAIFETLKSNKGLWDFFCHSTDENSIPVISTLFCAVESLTCFLVSRWTCFSTLLLMPSIQSDIFVRSTSQNVRPQSPPWISTKEAIYFLHSLHLPGQSCQSPSLSCKTEQRGRDVEFLYVTQVPTTKEASSQRETEGMRSSPRAGHEGCLRVQNLLTQTWGTAERGGSQTWCSLEYLVSRKKVMNHINS